MTNILISPINMNIAPTNTNVQPNTHQLKGACFNVVGVHQSSKQRLGGTRLSDPAWDEGRPIEHAKFLLKLPEPGEGTSTRIRSMVCIAVRQPQLNASN